MHCTEQAQSLQVQRLPAPLVRRPQKTTRPKCRASAIAGASTMTPQVKKKKKKKNNNNNNNDKQAQSLQVQRLPGTLVRRPHKTTRPECRGSAIAGASTMTPEVRKNNSKYNNEQAQSLRVQRLPGPLARRSQKKCLECRSSAIAGASTMTPQAW